MEQQRNREYDVFISYARKDYIDEDKIVKHNNPISRLVEAFDKNGISYWIDEKGIYSGDRFAKMIANSIKNCKTFLFVSSENSNASEWTVGEIAVAREYKKKIIPFRIDDATYNENIIVYLAPIDFASYVENPEKAITKVVEAINEHKESLKKKEEEDQRRAAANKARQEEQERIEWELRQKENQRKEQERLAAITEERKKKEEELNAIYNQLRELDAETARRKDKKIQLENEIKTIDNKLSFIDKQYENLESRRKYLEKYLSAYAQNDITQNESQEENHNVPLGERNNNQNRKIQWFTTIEKKWYAIAVAMSVIIVLVVVFLMSNNTSLEQSSTLVLDSLEVQNDSVASESAFCFIPVETDDVYGIDAMARISNWRDLRVSLPNDSDKLHKISFAFIKVLEGLGNYVPESKRNREDASKAGIRVALYHALNIYPHEKNATGKDQASKYYEYVRELRNHELPPVLVIPSPDSKLSSEIRKSQISCAIDRAQEWIDEITEIYNVTPIVHVPIYKEYIDFYQGKLHNCRFWLTENNKVGAQFIKKPNWNGKAKYYNGIEQNSSYSGMMEINVFNGKYQDFINFK